MEFRERVDQLSKEYGVISGQLYDYTIYLGFQLAIKHPLIRLFNKEEFQNLKYNMTEHKLRNGYLQQKGYRLERIVREEVQKYRRA
jgi:hypothetical protein